MTWKPRHERHFFEQVCFDPATATFIALSAVSAISKTSAANKQAKGVIAEGNIVAANKAKEINQKAATQRVSFLNSGLTLEGTPMNAIDSTFNTGLEDLTQIRNNYNTKSKNIIRAGRTEALTSLFSGAAGAIGGNLGDFSTGFGQGFSNSATLQTGANIGTAPSFNGLASGFGPA